MKIYVTGSGGMLGRAVCKVLSNDHSVIGLKHEIFDIVKLEKWLQIAAHQPKPDVIVHCAAFTHVDEAEREENRRVLWNTNVESLNALCDVCLENQIRLIFPQTFLVLRDQIKFHDANSGAIEPLSLYAKSKWEAEKILKCALPSELRMIVRLGGFFGGGPERDKNFVGLFLNHILPNAIRDNKSCIHVGDRVWQPTWTNDIADIIKWALQQPWREFYQYAASDYATFAELAQAILEIIGIDEIKIREIPAHQIPAIAIRPQQIIMQSSNELIRGNLVYGYRKRLKTYLTQEWPNYRSTHLQRGSAV
jgi:dTDP-4-dehydrorhamnose reductase